jgi:hypothetical protein
LAPGDPQIYAVYLNDYVLRSKGPILIRVFTNADVVKVISRSNGREGIVPKEAPGQFYAASVLPPIPFIASGMSIDLEFVASNAAGKTTSVSVPLKLR